MNARHTRFHCLWLALAAGAPAQPPAEERPWLALARRAARWLETRQVETDHGLTWRVGAAFEPGEPRSELYHGAAGVVLFLLEAHHATGEASFLDRARAGADHLAAAGHAGQHGLYTGTAGIAFALWETYRRTREPRHAAAARERLARVHAAAVPAGDGACWGPVTDVIGGSAGIGLFLLYAARAMDDPASLELARRAGRWLIAQGTRERGGVWWPMTAGQPRNYPNFSHGTAGVAYFLAELHRATGEPEFLEAALDGARYLEAVAVDGLVFHHEPGGEGLYYLGWCHGPAGTTRLYEALFDLTGEARWGERIDAALDALVESGIPERRPEGFWNNAGQCCGTAGVIECLLAVGSEPAHRELLVRLAGDLRARGSDEAGGTRWVLAEHRVRPELLGAQTGYMQGAAGIGLCCLRLDGAERGREPAIVLPDAPPGGGEQACRRAAARLIASEPARAGARYGGAVPVRHPLLDEHLPGETLYLTELRAPEGEDPAAPSLHDYLLTTVRAGSRTGTAWPRGAFDALAHLRAADVRATTADDVAEVHALERLLDRLGGGCSQRGAPLLPAELQARFGLGPGAATEPAPAIAATPTRRYAVTCRVQSDEQDATVALSYRLLVFERESGRLLGAEVRPGEVVPAAAFDATVPQRELERFAAELARGR